ncbi:MAG TPA: thiamine diphosphokinase [Syntrophomonadaceae bacterium]|jgi:thiamine pyrophosphokinase|nr:thiamine diphosphokinase [Syntrophomonadaceae bacterium]HRX21785.1 thiamine diphosphokinase [Syntrophomonadaceae bacterium]
MKCLLMANGKYGDITAYYGLADRADLVICADGGANYAYQMGVLPDYIIGDLDSIRPEVREYFNKQQVIFKAYPPAKDFTDTQLALETAEDLGADEIIFVGTLGGRLDHTLANLYSCIETVRKGKKVSHFGSDVTIYLVNSQVRLKGRTGDLVSIIALTEKATGINISNFAYPLQDAVLYQDKPYAVSNRMLSDTAEIRVKKGIIAVFHYQ